MFFIYTLWCVSAFAITGNEILSATGVKAGLCAIIGSRDADLISQLHNNGTILVSACAQDIASWKATQDVIQKNGLYGVVSVMLPLTLKQLPYMSNTVTLLVADLDALGANGPSIDELKRVTSPFGAIYYQQAGQWHKIKKELPNGMDEWRHQYYGADGNPVSHDRFVNPECTRLRFINSGAIIGTGPMKGMTLSSGKMVYRYHYKDNQIVCRDAFNGLPVWSKKNSDFVFYAAADGKENIYVADKIGEPAKAWNISTGELVGNISDAGAISNLYQGWGVTSIISTNSIVLIPNGKILTACDKNSLAKKWSFTSNDNVIVAQCIDTVGKRVFVVEGPFVQRASRWDGAPFSSVTCLDLNSGAFKWRCSEFVGKGGGTRTHPNCTQILYSQGNIYVMGGTGILVAYGDPFLCRIDTLGNLLWKTHYQDNLSRFASGRFNADAGSFGGVSYSGTSYWPAPTTAGGEAAYWGQTLMSWGDGDPYLGYHAGLRRYNKTTGSLDKDYGGNIGGGACNRGMATDNYYWTAGSCFVDKAGMHSRHFISRSGCAYGAYPAYGAIYYHSGWCTCMNFIHGLLALSSDNLPAVLSNDKRLDKATLNASLSILPRKFSSSNSIVQDWSDPHQLTSTTITSGTQAGAYQIRSNVHEQRVEAVNGSTVVWSFLAGSRVPMQPIVLDGKCYFGSHDGWVYCLDAQSGNLQWRFLAAPSEQQVVSFSQIESNWPVRGIALVNGTLYCCAGRQAELDGGMYLWGLNPSNGSITWSCRLHSPPRKGTAPFTPIPNINAAAQSGPLWNGIDQASTSLTLTKAGFNRDNFRSSVAPIITSSGTYSINIQEWNGKVIDPRTSAVVNTINNSIVTNMNKQVTPVKVNFSNSYIHISSSQTIKTIHIINGSGKSIYTNKNGASKSFRTPKVQNGFYVVKTKLGNGQSSEALILIP